MWACQDTPFEPELSLQNAQLSVNAGRFDLALEQLAPAMVQLRQEANAPILAMCLLLQAGIHQARGDSAAAHAAAIESYTLFAQCDNVPASLQAQRILIEVHLDMGDCVQAARQARWALSMSQDFGQDAESAWLTLSLSKALLRGDWFLEGIQTLQHAMRRHTALAQPLSNFAVVAGTALAHAHWRFAQALQESGQLVASVQQRQLAVPALPEPWAMGRGANLEHLMALGQRAQLNNQWGHTAAARGDVLRMLSLARRSGSPARYRAIALEALADIHAWAGRLQHALRCRARIVSLLGTTDLAAYQAHAMERLAISHSHLGHHQEALGCRRLAHRLHLEGRQRQQAMRPAPVRGATMVPVLNRDHHHQDPYLLSLGRLLGQMQHAIVASAPMIKAAVEPAVRAPKVNAPGATESMALHVQRTVTCTDRTASLVRQLKMFAFRVSPQRTVVAVERALEDAWERFQQHTPLKGWSMAFLHRDPVRTSALSVESLLDAQRFAVFLTVILAGLTANTGQQTTARVIWVDLRPLCPGTSRLTLGVSGEEGLPSDEHWPRWMCAELAQQLGLHLSFLGDNEKLRCLQLELPLQGAS
jgi:tetratricopeptide (TPR) repeat protein